MTGYGPWDSVIAVALVRRSRRGRRVLPVLLNAARRLV
jgi:hypothetical protein